MKWAVRAQLPTAPELCVRAACAVQLLWELSLLLWGMWCFPGMQHYPGRDQEGFHLHSAHSVAVLSGNWLWCS